MYTSGNERTNFFVKTKYKGNRILKSGIQPLMESGVHGCGIRNPQRGIWNPRLSWITLHRAKFRIDWPALSQSCSIK